jgi:hypothetical protein
MSQSMSELDNSKGRCLDVATTVAAGAWLLRKLARHGNRDRSPASDRTQADPLATSPAVSS